MTAILDALAFLTRETRRGLEELERAIRRARARGRHGDAERVARLYARETGQWQGGGGDA